MNTILAPISIGELYDKISILQIKREKILDPDKLKNIEKELEELGMILNNIWNKHGFDNVMFVHIKDINEKLWEIEDHIRIKERNKQYDEEFISLARSVYFWNDKRAVVKKEINLKYDSSIIEEKSYEKY
jgi:hypothetical protein